MANHRATWVRLRKMARERFLNDELVMEIAAREAFDTKETATYAADLDAAIEEQGILEAAHVAMSLRKELREELREEGHVAEDPPDGDNKGDDDDFFHLDDLDGDFHAKTWGRP
jgi:hypothetical protein